MDDFLPAVSTGSDGTITYKWPDGFVSKRFQYKGVRVEARKTKYGEWIFEFSVNKRSYNVSGFSPNYRKSLSHFKLQCKEKQWLNSKTFSPKKQK